MFKLGIFIVIFLPLAHHCYQVSIYLCWAGGSYSAMNNKMGLVLSPRRRWACLMAARRKDQEEHNVLMLTSLFPFSPAHLRKHFLSPFNKYILAKVRWNFRTEFLSLEYEWKLLSIQGCL